MPSRKNEVFLIGILKANIERTEDRKRLSNIPVNDGRVSPLYDVCMALSK
jgi:hypothetical protein